MPSDGTNDPARQDQAVLKQSDLNSEVAASLEALSDRKGRDLVVLDLRGLSTATDFFVLATGTSDIHVRSIAENVIDGLKGDGVRPDHVEGLQGGRWVLIDYIDFVIHVFHREAREFYQLEDLWGDAPRLDVEG
jgi:ribosome-associated protein